MTKTENISSMNEHYMTQDITLGFAVSDHNFTWYSFSQDNSPEKLKLAQFPP